MNQELERIFISSESTKISEPLIRKIALAILRKYVNHDVALAASFINETLDKGEFPRNAYWLSPDGKEVRTTKCLKSHHKKEWLIAGKIIEASQGNLYSLKLNGLPRDHSYESIKEWTIQNNINHYSMHDFVKILGYSKKKPSSSKESLKYDISNPSKDIIKILENIKNSAQFMPRSSHDELKSLVIHYENELSRIINIMNKIYN